MKKYSIPVYFGVLHGINDFVAGNLLASYSLSHLHTQKTVMVYLAYSLLAFGGQLPVGWKLDANKKLKEFIILSIVLLIAACVSSSWFLVPAIIISGIASAFLHVSGGTVCFLNNTKSTIPAGIFTAPGVLGLILGGITGQYTSNWLMWWTPALLLLFFILLKINLPDYEVMDQPENEPILETHDYIMLILLLAIAMRSMIWNILNVLAGQHHTIWLLGIGIAAFAGKLFGGFITEKVDWKKYVFISIGLSALLLSLGRNHLMLFCTGILLLQSAVPITLWMMQQFLRKQPAAATALSLGAAIILAGLPSYLYQFQALQQDNKLLSACFILLLLLNVYWVFMTKRRKPFTKPN